jgi:hypothetical protein
LDRRCGGAGPFIRKRAIVGGLALSCPALLSGKTQRVKAIATTAERPNAMATFLVTYDLNLETKRPNITKKLRDSFSSWAKLSESSYAVVTNSSATEVYNIFKPMLDGNDSLFVITLKRPYYGQGSKEVIDWLEANVTY